MKDKPLADALKAFLEGSKRVSRTQVHRIIKEFYLKRGNYRAAPRGDPAKGYKIKQANKGKSG
jgi:hypothetical protein